MKVVLTNRFVSEWLQAFSSQIKNNVEDDCNCDCNCDCDCDCACPTDGTLMPTLSTPIAYYMELTPFCNNHCPNCGNLFASDRQMLPHPLNGKEWVTYIENLASHTHQIRLTGGEATLHPDFFEIIFALERLKIPFTLFSNARWTHPEKMICALRTNSMFEGLLVSLHGHDSITHDAFSGVSGSFLETTLNIESATAAGLSVATSMVINARNWDRIEETLEKSIQLGANHLVCNRMIDVQLTHLSPDVYQLRAAIQKIENLRRLGASIRFGNCIPQCFEPSSSIGCTAGNSFATIDPWGRVRPCNHAPVIVGDLRHQTIEEIWDSPALHNWRQRVPFTCTTCAAFHKCHGGCRAEGMLRQEVQDPLITSPFPSNFPISCENEELVLYAELRPIPQFIQHKEGNQIYLVHKSKVLKVPTEYQPYMDQMNGNITLRQINDNWGSNALDWVGSLYRKDFITWAI